MPLHTITEAVRARAESASVRAHNTPTEKVRAFLREEYGAAARQCTITLADGHISIRGCPSRIAQSIRLRMGEIRTILKGRTACAVTISVD